jgi:hypothetical protein
LVSGLVSAIEEYAAADAVRLPSAVQLADLEELLAAERRLSAEIGRRLAAAEATDAMVAETGYTPRSWLMAEMDHTGRSASRRLKLARACQRLPELGRARADGDLSDDNARLLAKLLSDIPAGADREAAEQVLLPLARVAGPAELGRAAGELRERLGLDEDADAAREKRYGERHLTADRTFDGYLTGRYLLDPQAAAALLAALGAHIGKAGPDDERTIGQRRADALAEVCESHLAADPLPDERGERPRVVLVADYDTLRAQVAERFATLDGRWQVSPATSRRMLCDAEVLPAVLGGDGAVLDLGRTSKAWSTAQRRAVRLRDGDGCAFGGCPHRWSRLHHAAWWSRGGPTDLSNAVPVCRFHHWLVHDGGWHASRAPEGTVIFTDRDGRERRFRPAGAVPSTADTSAGAATAYAVGHRRSRPA